LRNVSVPKSLLLLLVVVQVVDIDAAAASSVSAQEIFISDDSFTISLVLVNTNGTVTSSMPIDLDNDVPDDVTADVNGTVLSTPRDHTYVTGHSYYAGSGQCSVSFS
jgi:hypothetical protein